MLGELAELFFNVGGLGVPGLLFGETDKLVGELLKPFKTGDSGLNHGQLWWGDSLGFVFALVPALQGKVRPLRSSLARIGLGTELATDDVRDLPHFLEDGGLFLLHR